MTGNCGLHLQVARYHAGMEQAERSEGQIAFMCNEAWIMVASSAFGMGVNKSDIRR